MFAKHLLLAACLYFMPLTSSSAAILAFGGEDTSFNNVAGCLSNTTATRFRAAFARGSMAVAANTGAVDPPADRCQTFVFTAGNVLWFHAQFWDSGNVSVANQQSVIFRSPDGVSRVILRQTATWAQLKASSRNAAGTISDLATGATAEWSQVTVTSIDVKVDYSASGGVQVWINGASVIAFVGDPRTDAATQLNQIEFACLSNNGASWSEIIVADEDTRSMVLATLALQAPGNTQAWTPSTLANVNKATINDATFISDPTGNVLSQWTTPTTAPAGSWGVKSVSIEARLLKSTSGPSQFDWIWRIGNANFLAGMSNALTTTFANYRLQRDTSPATSTTWGINEVYNTSSNQMNIGVKSLP